MLPVRFVPIGGGENRPPILLPGQNWRLCPRGHNLDLSTKILGECDEGIRDIGGKMVYYGHSDEKRPLEEWQQLEDHDGRHGNAVFLLRFS